MVLYIDSIGFNPFHATAGPVHELWSGTAVKGSKYLKYMLRIDTIENASAVTLTLHGRLFGPWVPLLETLWRSTEGELDGRKMAVDLTDVTAIDGAGRYLLRLMEAKSVTLEGGGMGIRALLGEEHGLAVSGSRLKSPKSEPMH
jgi:hypothetical protein